MSMYIPEIKEEVSENAKMLVEDGGKIVRTGMPKGGSDVLWLNDFSHTPENALMLEEHFKAGKTLMYDGSNYGTPFYSRVIMCTREYDDATGADSIVFYYYGSNSQLGAFWLAI